MKEAPARRPRPSGTNVMLRLGSRGSALAMAQSGTIAHALRARGHDVEVVPIRTEGDVAKGSLSMMGGMGVFAAELRTAVLEHRCDFAVHSMKDLPTTPVPGLVIAAVPHRAPADDVLCARDGLTFSTLPPGARVGTGSPRRVAQLRALRPDLNFVDIRGNIGTRLARVTDGDLDAVVLAMAGLQRLDLAAAAERLPIVPAPGQGALAVECRADATQLVTLLSSLDDTTTRAAVETERQVLRFLGGGCAAPIAAHASGGTLRAGVFALDGSASITVETPDGGHAAESAVRELLARGAADIADLTESRPSRLAELHDDSSLWSGNISLAGTRVLLTTEEGPLAVALRAAGAETVACPVQRMVPLPAADTLEGADWVAITSARTLRALRVAGLRIPPDARIAAVGGATALALREAGYTVDLVPEGSWTAADLAAAWPAGSGTVALPGSILSSGVLADGLREKGYTVRELPLYTMEPLETLPTEVAADWRRGRFDVVVILSGSAGAAVDSLLGLDGAPGIIAFGPPSAQWLSERGLDVTAVAPTQDAPGIVSAVAEAMAERQGP